MKYSVQDKIPFDESVRIRLNVYSASLICFVKIENILKQTLKEE